MGYSETEEKIFRAALEEFAERGKDGARMQSIADRAGINKALVHYYFRTKEKLYHEAFEFIIRKYFSQIAESIDGQKDFASMLKALIDRYYDLLDGNPMLYKFMFREVIGGTPGTTSTFKCLMEEAGTNPLEAFTVKLKEAIRRKEIRSVDPMQTFITILGSLVFFFLGYPLLSCLNPTLEQNRERFLRERKKQIYDILYNGLKPRMEHA